MQEQLKAQQLEELLRLQEEQQRLLGRMNGSQDYAAGTNKKTNNGKMLTCKHKEIFTR